MSDFTKYELQSLLLAIHYVRERTNNCGDVMRRLLKKIEFMIENYCDHHWERLEISNNVVCHKCHKMR